MYYLGFKTITKERKETGMQGDIMRKRSWGKAPRTKGGKRAMEVQARTGAMADMGNSSYSEERDLERISLRQGWVKVSKALSQSISWVW
jgi:hypothetical protein